ncbi:uncharacterized protein LOC118749446 [Rhagoletis pomonella]|uniref:uncharacterized protein LOC118749446 n=1 Tax=Rhagoletis pomonella TaxID=28610 RepID=UPI001784B064|nr:uncharacterized protein LOC118749446 [Rhagoletis pomonella]
MYTVVQGISETTSFGLDETVDLEVEVLDLTEEEVMPSTSTGQKRARHDIQASTPKRKKETSLLDCLKESLELQKNFNRKVEGVLDSLMENREENLAAMQRFCDAMEKTNETLDGIREDFKNHHENIERILHKK